MFLLVISNTKVAHIEGISAAGVAPELVRFTPVADAEFLLLGKVRSIDTIPVDPYGHPTPAVISRAVYEMTGIPAFVVRAGTEIAPKLPYLCVSCEPGGDIRSEEGVSDVERVVAYSSILGRQLSGMTGRLMVGESVPGGTTTAQAVFNALGYKASVSSASLVNPLDLKKRVMKEAFERRGISAGDLQNNPMDAVRFFGDPMMATVMGLSAGFDGELILCGGTQMLAVAALIKAYKRTLEGVKLVTTRYVVEDTTANLLSMAGEIGIAVEVAPLNLSRSRFEGLRDYEKGFVKEGVGAGALFKYALDMGFPAEEIVDRIDSIYETLVGGGA